MKELAPTGKLRVALVFAPSMSHLLRREGGERQAAGVTADIAEALGKKLNLPGRARAVSELRAGGRRARGGRGRRRRSCRSTRSARSASRSGRTTCSRESTYMVTAASGAKTVEDVDKAGMRVIGIANTTTIRAADAHAEEHHDLAGHLGRAKRSRCCATARPTRSRSARNSLPPYVAQVPGSRMTDGAFQQIGIAIAVAKGKPPALAAVTEFMNDGEEGRHACAARSTSTGSRIRWRRDAVKPAHHAGHPGRALARAGIHKHRRSGMGPGSRACGRLAGTTSAASDYPLARRSAAPPSDISPPA